MASVPSSAPAAPKAAPGYMQASYWLSLVGVIVTVLVVTGLVPAQESATVASLLTDLVTKFFVLLSALVPIWQFVHTRVVVPSTPRPSPDARPTPAAPDVPTSIIPDADYRV